MLVTGASRGIGAQIALLAGQAGYKVGVNYLNSAGAAQEVVAQIKAAGGQAVAIQADTTKSQDVLRLFREVDEQLGTLDVLVNNAGILKTFLVEDTNDDNVAEIFNANVLSVFYCTRQAVLRMSTAHGGRGGSIINLTSVAARLGTMPGGVAYAASKGAIDSFNLALSKEVGGQGIRVNAVRPGLISTEMHNATGGVAEMESRARAVVPMGRAGTAREVAEAAIWLASDAASYVHGSVIDVAGGR